MLDYVHDFSCPAGRLIQKATGHDCTLFDGEVSVERAEYNAALAGHVLRSDPVLR